MYLYSTEEALEIVQKWLECRLEKADWTHETHLLCGFWVLLNFQENALAAMRERIKKYNETVGTVNSDTSGYHETMTVFWLWALRNWAIEKDIDGFNEVSVDQLLFDENLARRNDWLLHFSEEKMKSVEARRGFVEPDRAAMRGVDFFVKG